MDILFNEKNNLEIAHIDIVEDYKNLKGSHEKTMIMNRTLKLEVEELSNKAENLKGQIISQYHDSTGIQDIPTDILQPPELLRELNPTESQQAMENLMLEKEAAILSDLETTDIFKMKDRIKNYIENNVRLNR